ncbi:MAG: DegQ family serine endoprotease [Thermodesulfobacteriota bacterium]|nr:MAG: DegQ family serine endoprotease [Thermodesulfobacteriota bacterium]
MNQKRKGFGLKTIVLVAIISVVAGVMITARFDMTNTTTAQNFWQDADSSPQVTGAVPNNFVELARKLSPVVVNISTTQVMKERPTMPFPEFRGPFEEFFGDDFRRFFEEPPGGEMKRQSLGSGFILNAEGYILTNFHVIENATEIIVTLSEDKKEYKATVVGQDQKLDIALIKIKPEESLPIAVMGDSDRLQIGEWVLAIGNPFGLGGTVTAGIVSQKGRVIGAGPYDNFLQTDASINPGNSGGPLFNIKGEVVGVNTAIVAGGQGIGFATPINMVKEVLLQLKETGKVTRGWIGVSIQELTPELARSFGVKEARGVLISSVNPNEPADQAGLKAGDIIISFDGRQVNELSDLPRVVATTPPGKNSEVKVLRDGKERVFFVKVGIKVDEEITEPAANQDNGSPDKRLGISAQPITPEIAKRLGKKETDGVIISSVKPDSAAADAGLKRGDLVKEIDRKPIRGMADYSRALNEAEKNDIVLFLVERGGNTIYVIVKPRK